MSLHGTSPRAAVLTLALCASFVLRASPPPDELRRRALDGSAEAQLELASEFLFGRNRPGNPALAAYWYRRAARSGSPAGEYNLGACYEHGWGVRKSLQQAFRHYTAAAEKEFMPALTRRALLLFSGVPAEEWSDVSYPKIDAEPEKALEELRRAAQSYAPAKLALALRLYRGAEERERHAAEIARLAAAVAEDPDAGPEALLFYAECLLNGVGVPADPKRGVAVLERAAQAGSASALSQLGKIYEFGLGVPPDPERALELYRRAAELNDPAGMLRLGDHYLSGDRLPADPVRAFELYRRAAELDHPPAFAKFGDCLAGGWGVPKDLAAAFAAYESGAKLGDPAAQFRLGRCYAEALGTQADPAAAVFWYRCAGTAGNRDAVRELGKALLHGRGVPENPAEGRRLLEAAARAGDLAAAEELESL